MTSPAARVIRTTNGSGSVTAEIWPNGMRSTLSPAGAITSARPATSTSACPSSRFSPAADNRRYSAVLTGRRSARRGAALAAEPRAGQRGAAVAAELLRRLRRGHRVTAALAELPATAVLAAGRAQPGGLVPVVDVPGPVLTLDLLVQLVHLRRGLHPRDLEVQPGRAGRAQPPLGVPA